MKTFHVVFSLFFVLLVGSPSSAWALDQGTVDFCNDVIKDIYDEIITIRDDHDELNAFGPEALTKNQYGIYQIQYAYKDPRTQKDDPNYEIGLTIVPSDDTSFPQRNNKVFNLSFPLLQLKLTGYQERSLWLQYDLEKSVSRYGQVLWAYQQEQMPFHLELSTEKQTVKTDEPIEFTVTLKNVSPQNMWVKSLEDKNLLIVYNGQPSNPDFGKPTKGRKDKERGVLLKSGESIQRGFRLDGFSFPRQVDIQATYDMTYEGIRPSDVLMISVVR